MIPIRVRKTLSIFELFFGGNLVIMAIIRDWHTSWWLISGLYLIYLFVKDAKGKS